MRDRDDNNQDVEAKSAKLLDAIKRLADLPVNSNLAVAMDSLFTEINSLLEQGANPNWRNANNESPLYIASIHHLTDVIDYLVKYGAEFAQADIAMFREHMAEITDRNALQFVQGVITVTDLAASAYFDESANMLNHGQEQDNNYEIVNETGEELMEQWELDVPDEDMGVDKVAELTEALSQTDKMSDDDESLDAFFSEIGLEKPMTDAFMQAAKNGDISKIEELLESGININVVDQHGNSALHWAAKEYHMELYDDLIAKGIDTNIENQKQQKAADMFLALDDVPAATVDDNPLNENNINDIDPVSGDNALLIAAQLDEWEMVMDILNIPSVDYNHKNATGADLHHYAEKAGRQEVLDKIRELTSKAEAQSVDPARKRESAYAKLNLFSPQGDKAAAAQPDPSNRKSLK